MWNKWIGPKRENTLIIYQHTIAYLTLVVIQYSFLSTRGIYDIIKLMKGKAFGKQSRHEKIAASVLLKLFISGNERCHSTDAH